MRDILISVLALAVLGWAVLIVRDERARVRRQRAFTLMALAAVAAVRRMQEMRAPLEKIKAACDDDGGGGDG